MAVINTPCVRGGTRLIIAAPPPDARVFEKTVYVLRPDAGISLSEANKALRQARLRRRILYALGVIAAASAAALTASALQAPDEAA